MQTCKYIICKTRTHARQKKEREHFVLNLQLLRSRTNKEPPGPGNPQAGPGTFSKHVDGVARRDTLHRSLSTQASRRSTFVVGARAATTAVVCFGAARARSINWPARSTWRRTATPWNTTSTQRREWSPACSTRGRRSKHICFTSLRVPHANGPIICPGGDSQRTRQFFPKKRRLRGEGFGATSPCAARRTTIA